MSEALQDGVARVYRDVSSPTRRLTLCVPRAQRQRVSERVQCVGRALALEKRPVRVQGGKGLKRIVRGGD